jgi:hypothetical protein
MAQIYLGLDNVVRVDGTPDGRHAQTVAAARQELRFLSACERLAISLIADRARRGQDAQRQHRRLVEVRRYRAEAMARGS